MFYQTFTVVHFYANQTELAEKYCINKDKPELNCEGKCHLEKKLVKADVNSDKNTTKSVRSCLLCFISIPKVVPINVESNSEQLQNWFYQSIKPSNYTSDFFIPPQIL